MTADVRRLAGRPAHLAAMALPVLALACLPAPAQGQAVRALPRSGASAVILAQTTEPDPSSVDALKSAIDEIKAKLARQRAASQPAGTATSDLAQQLRDAGERTADLARQIEALRTERDGLRQELSSAREEAIRLGAKSASLERAAKDAQADLDGRVASLEQRIKDIDQAREGALARVAALEAELTQERTARSAGDEALERTRADLAEVTRARDAAAHALAARDADLNRLSSSLAQLQAELTDRERKLTAATDEGAALRKSADEASAAKATLEAQVAEVRSQAEEQAKQRAAAMASDVEASRVRAQKLDEEIAALRAIASSSVKDVQDIGGQLLVALKDNQELTAALGELRATNGLLDGQLAASRADLDAAHAALDELRAKPVPPAGDAAAAEAPEGGEMALVPLRANDGDNPVAAPAGSEVAALLSDLKLTDSGDGWMMTIPEDLEFAPGSDVIRQGSTGSLEKVAELIKVYGTPAVRIVGHTDGEGDAAFNRRLSQRRAQAVREFLVTEFDVEPRLVTTEGYGETRPIASNETGAGRRLNRRVEVYVKP